MAGLLQRVLWNLPEEVAARWSYDAAVDVLIVGGGVQGLCHLADLSEAGYSTALLATEPIGEGPSEHWNGVLSSGYDDPAPGRHESIEDDWLPLLEDHGLEYASGEWYAAVQVRAADRIHSAWEDAEYPFDETGAEALPPEWRDGELFDGTAEHEVSEIEEYAVSKAELVSAFVEAYGDRIVRGGITGYEFGSERDDLSIDAVTIDLEMGAELRIEPGYVVTTTVGGTPELLDSLAEEEGFEAAGGDPERVRSTLDDVGFRDVHRLAVRSPRGALPEANVHVLPRGVTVAVHHERAGKGVGRVRWYVTSESFDSRGRDEADGPATGRIDPRLAGAGFSELFNLVPAVSERAERENSGIEFGVVAGIDPRIEEGRAFVEPAGGVSNLLVSIATPEDAWVASDRVGSVLEDAIDSGEGADWLPTDLTTEDVPGPDDGVNWLDRDELVVRYPESDPPTEGASSVYR